MQYTSDGGGTANKAHGNKEGVLDVQMYSISQEIPWREAISITECNGNIALWKCAVIANTGT